MKSFLLFFLYRYILYFTLFHWNLQERQILSCVLPSLIHQKGIIYVTGNLWNCYSGVCWGAFTLHPFHFVFRKENSADRSHSAVIKGWRVHKNAFQGVSWGSARQLFVLNICSTDLPPLRSFLYHPASLDEWVSLHLSIARRGPSLLPLTVCLGAEKCVLHLLLDFTYLPIQ